MSDYQFSPFPYFTLVSKDEARVAICVGGSLDETVAWSQQITDHRLDDTRLMQSHVFDERPPSFDVNVGVSATPSAYYRNIWETTCRNLGFVQIAPTAQSGPDRVTQIIEALRTERKRIWTVYSARNGILESYMIVTCSHGFSGTMGTEVKLSMKRVDFATAESIYMPAPTPRARAAQEYALPNTESPYTSDVPLGPEEAPAYDPEAFEDILGKMNTAGNGDDDFNSAISGAGDELSGVISFR